MRAALYARYSTDKQSEASIDDQLRVCERLAERHGFTVVARFTDAAISGGTARRPGYQAMLEAARRGEFRVIVAEDASRLWRNLAEQAPRLAELTDLGVAVVTHDLDTRAEAAGMLAAVLGASSEAYRREIGRRTRRGLEGRARAKLPTGGRAYGYYSAAESPTGDRAVHPERAEIVREIFARFAAGASLRSIASDLNARGVPSPAATWKRTERATDGRWRVSALHAMLQNDIYVGRLVWNRSRWERSAVDSKKRRRVENPRSAWIIHERPELRIVDDVTWQRVQERFAERVELFPGRRGVRTTYLLSGLLRCGVCGGAYVIAAHRPPRYGCSTYRHAGTAACANRILVPSRVAEEKILASVRQRMLSPAAIEHAVRTMRALARTEAPVENVDTAQIEAQIAELERLRAAGVLSPEIAGAALARAHRELEVARRPRRTNVQAEVFGAEAEYREAAEALSDAIKGDDVPAAREALKAMLGPITLRPQGNRLEAELSAGRVALAVNCFGSGGSLWKLLL